MISSMSSKTLSLFSCLSDHFFLLKMTGLKASTNWKNSPENQQRRMHNSQLTVQTQYSYSIRKPRLSWWSYLMTSWEISKTPSLCSLLALYPLPHQNQQRRTHRAQLTSHTQHSYSVRKPCPSPWSPSNNQRQKGQPKQNSKQKQNKQKSTSLFLSKTKTKIYPFVPLSYPSAKPFPLPNSPPPPTKILTTREQMDREMDRQDHSSKASPPLSFPNLVTGGGGGGMWP